MAHYRIYCCDGAGKVWTADWIEAASDEDAIKAARALDMGFKCEVWEGKRFVATVERDDPQMRLKTTAPPTAIRSRHAPDSDSDVV